MAWTFGLDFERVSIVPTEEWRGALRMGSRDEDMNDFDNDLLRARALTTLAGEVAAETLTGMAMDWGEWLDHPGSDIDQYIGLADHLGWYEMDGKVIDFVPTMEERVAEVRTLLVERWAAVEALASALLQDQEVSGTDALCIMKEAGVPGPVASVWADFLEERKAEAANHWSK